MSIDPFGMGEGRDFSAECQDVLSGLLDAQPFPAVMIDDKAGVVAANRRAREQFAAEGALVNIADGKFKLSPGLTGRPNFWVVLDELRSVSGAGERRLIQLDAVPDGVWLILERVGARSGMLIASVRCLADLQPRTPEALARLFQLTPSEASLLRAVVSAGSIADYAASCGREPTTVRWHMRNLLSKTGCRSQRELNNLALMLII